MFCFTEQATFPVDGELMEIVERITQLEMSIFKEGSINRQMIERLKKLIESQEKQFILLYEEIDYLIKKDRQSPEYTNFGALCRKLISTITENTVIDLRKATWDQVRTIGTIPLYQWSDANNNLHSLVKLSFSCQLILWDGRKVGAYWGDYVVKCQDDPLIFGSISYMSHEISPESFVSPKK